VPLGGDPPLALVAAAALVQHQWHHEYYEYWQRNWRHSPPSHPQRPHPLTVSGAATPTKRSTTLHYCSSGTTTYSTHSTPALLAPTAPSPPSTPQHPPAPQHSQHSQHQHSQHLQSTHSTLQHHSHITSTLSSKVISHSHPLSPYHPYPLLSTTPEAGCTKNQRH
jgi:hypothetical protein